MWDLLVFEMYNSKQHQIIKLEFMTDGVNIQRLIIITPDHPILLKKGMHIDKCDGLN